MWNERVLLLLLPAITNYSNHTQAIWPLRKQIWTEEISEKHFEIKDLDFNNHYQPTQADKKHVLCGMSVKQIKMRFRKYQPLQSYTSHTNPKNSLKLTLITRSDDKPAGLTESTWLNFALIENSYNAIKLAPTWIFLMIPLLWDIKTGVKYLEHIFALNDSVP